MTTLTAMIDVSPSVVRVIEILRSAQSEHDKKQVIYELIKNAKIPESRQIFIDIPDLVIALIHVVNNGESDELKYYAAYLLHRLSSDTLHHNIMRRLPQLISMMLQCIHAPHIHIEIRNLMLITLIKLTYKIEHRYVYSCFPALFTTLLNVVNNANSTYKMKHNVLSVFQWLTADIQISENILHLHGLIPTLLNAMMNDHDLLFKQKAISILSNLACHSKNQQQMCLYYQLVQKLITVIHDCKNVELIKRAMRVVYNLSLTMRHELLKLDLRLMETVKNAINAQDESVKTWAILTWINICDEKTNELNVTSDMLTRIKRILREETEEWTIKHGLKAFLMLSITNENRRTNNIQLLLDFENECIPLIINATKLAITKQKRHAVAYGLECLICFTHDNHNLLLLKEHTATIIDMSIAIRHNPELVEYHQMILLALKINPVAVAAHIVSQFQHSNPRIETVNAFKSVTKF